VTLGDVITRMQCCDGVDDLNEVADLIRYLPTEQDREAATAAYNELREST
jgi:hypothetical protein